MRGNSSKGSVCSTESNEQRPARFALKNFSSNSRSSESDTWSTSSSTSGADFTTTSSQSSVSKEKVAKNTVEFFVGSRRPKPKLERRISVQKNKAAQQPASRFEPSEMVQAYHLAQVVPPTLDEMLCDVGSEPYTLTFFRMWASVMCCDENIAFLLALEAMRESPPEELQLQARALCLHYIIDGAPSEVNLNGSTRRDVTAEVDRVTCALEAALLAAELARPASPVMSHLRLQQHSSSELWGSDAVAAAADATAAAAADEAAAEQDLYEQHMCKVDALVDELMEVLSPARTQIQKLVAMDALPRFVDSISTALQQLSQGDEQLQQEGLNMARTAILLSQQTALQQQQLQQQQMRPPLRPTSLPLQRANGSSRRFSV
jgi:Regulator of G protein signaling domain